MLCWQSSPRVVKHTKHRLQLKGCLTLEKIRQIFFFLIQYKSYAK